MTEQEKKELLITLAVTSIIGSAIGYFAGKELGYNRLLSTIIGAGAGVTGTTIYMKFIK